MNLKKMDQRFLVAAFFFISIAFLIFLRLGYYPLWDDEANTAIFAHGVWETGDTSAIFGHNILGYRNGLELNAELKNRLIAPLAYYVAAPFVGLFDNSFFYARLPFAIAGLITIASVIFWLFSGIHWGKISLK
jgi:4-amino-4-deoxy-L-arabinose transferase-like glycosyltransferase